ncbi:N-acetylmuramoyl-L-alanine amidase family protein [Winogradskyella haliclonae]|uniref:N-acetylmuramoyl-L-alanine amidase n=1 Tax=Winogradskyella haliclonae TaxID=2048558 RepID=A0ABQ2BY38_9FLAO|nr:N-acetylmuramoyl-L-alanine amidase [Winogradskyella haliclonae]GGI57424.1 N-acetylmuramoyl-L-alanine amidase [Winogradskyella haliclonae]
MKTNKNYILVLMLIAFITSLTSFSFAQVPDDRFVVVLDAGHGGRDHGNLGNGYKEKNISLKVILELGKELEKLEGVKVIYTRKTDKFVDLWKRADIANKADADLFVSIHCNSVANPKPYGTETWVLGEKNTGRNFEFAKRENEVIFLEEDYEKNYAGFDPSSPESTIAIGIEQEVYVEQSILLARKIEDAFKNKVKRKSRGLKQKSLLVIRNTYMPSVLVELGFLTNKKEGAFLNTKTGQSKMAKAIKEAIIDYKNELDQNIGESIFVDVDEATTKTDTIEAEKQTTHVIEGVTFKVQIAASSKKLETKSYNFNGLSDISRVELGKLYKYYYGVTSDYNQAKLLEETAKSKGYSSCFIVAYKNGKRIPVEEALKSR